jgi:probable phosphoglycerate mutase
VGNALQTILLARHGETEWSLSGRHTGLTDLPLTDRGERNALQLGARLRRAEAAAVMCSPLQRAARTCELAGFAARADIDPDLVEWDYGEYEGRTSAEIRSLRPGWRLFRDGCPGGETPEDVTARADRVIERIRAIDGNVLLFSSGHIMRVLAARWLGLEAAAGARLALDTASLSKLGYEHDVSSPAIRLWNDTSHVSS